MRETKYKVWCHDKNEWEKDRVALLPSGVLLHETSGGWMPLKEKTHTVVFYVGLHDLEGKEMYERDVVRYADGDGECGVVGFAWGGLGVWLDGEYVIFGVDIVGGDVEVIGNIYENPELLERE